MTQKALRHLVLVLGDQLDSESRAFAGFDPAVDAVWMAENAEEATHVWAHQQRITFFFGAMRHFREAQRSVGRRVEYTELPVDPGQDRGKNFAELLRADLPRLRPEKLVVVQPGDYRVLEMLRRTARECSVELELRADAHFYATPEEFADWAEGREELVLEHFYRHLRKRHRVLVDRKGRPEGGQWNYDKDNRENLKGEDVGSLPRLPEVAPTALTREVMELVARRFSTHPGKAAGLSLPVDREGALAYLDRFVAERLEHFGPYEDAMWTGQPILYHSRLSALLNVKLLNPREVVDAVVEAYRERRLPLNSVEGLVRQVLGWREFVRGIYWRHMPEYAGMNALGAEAELPPFYWTGQTRMRCVREAMGSVLDHAYTHHIQRLMVLGLFALMYGVHPRKFHDWHMAMYLDAVDWVSLPSALGMSQYGDGGIVGTKPYCATGNYINRMSNYCRGCPYQYKEAAGEAACPFTTLYYDFLERHRGRFAENARMTFNLAALDRKSPDERAAIRERAAWLRAHVAEL